MSRRAVIVWLIIAVAVSLAAVALLRPTGPSAPDGPAMEFSPGAIQSLSVHRPGEDPVRVRRGLVPGDWELSWGPPEARESWPAIETQVNGALRLLSTLRLDPAPSGTGGPGDRAPRIELEGIDGRRWLVHVSPRSLGGRRVVWVDRPGGGRVAGVTETEIFEALVESGPLHWRQRRAVPGLGADVSRIRLQSPGSTLVLSRVENRWSLTEPVSAPADDTAVERVLGRLAGLQVSRFLDGPEEAGSGLDSPIARAVLETERRLIVGEGDLARAVDRRELVVGGAADLAQTELYARVDRKVGGVEGVPDPALSIGGGPAGEPRSTYITIPRAGLDGITLAAEAYVLPTVLRVPGSEVGGVVAELPLASAVGPAPAEEPVRIEVVRTLDGWARRSGTGEEVPYSGEPASHIRAIVSMLASRKADELLLGGDTGEGMIRLEVRSLTGAPLERVRLGRPVDAEGGTIEGRVAVVAGDVTRIYADPALAEAVEWLAGALRRERR